MYSPNPVDRRLRGLALLLSVLLAAAAFVVGGWALSHLSPDQSGPIFNTTSAPAAVVHAPPGMPGVVVRLQQAYASSDWGLVRRQVTDSTTALDLVQTMQRWKRDEVSGLHLTLVSTQRLNASDFVGTVEFWADPRALPDYGIFVFRTMHGNTSIVGSATGLRGESFRTANWTVTRSSHFVVYHSRYQLAGSDRHYLQDLEYERAQFARKFGVKLPAVADYYLYPTQSFMASMTQQACGSNPENIGCADPQAHPPTIHASTWPTYHEPIHVYQLALTPPPPNRNEVYVAPLFIGEGMAVALENRGLDPRLSDYCSELNYTPLDVCARDAMAAANPLTLLSDKGFQRADAGYAYALGGSFVKYLILHYGYRSFGHFYYVLAGEPSDRVQDYDAAALKVYHLRIATLIHRWSTELCGAGC